MNKNYSNNIIIISGTGRSGTTWIAKIFEKLLHYRILFEPFIPELVKEFKQFKYKPYIRQNAYEPDLKYFMQQLLDGNISNKWVDKIKPNFKPKGLIIKTIRANYFLKWIRNNFPKIPIIYIIRHPCGVVNSWEKLKWGSEDINSLLNQKLLINDHLYTFLNIFQNSNSTLSRNTCIWCAEQIVPFRTMSYSDWKVTTYEDLCINPDKEIENILRYIGDIKITKKITAKNIIPRTVRKNSAIIKGKNPLTSWEDELNINEVNQIMQIIKMFSLDFIYDRSFTPNKSNLIKILKKTIML